MCQEIFLSKFFFRILKFFFRILFIFSHFGLHMDELIIVPVEHKWTALPFFQKKKKEFFPSDECV